MQFREYGKTGVKLSVLGFGAMRLSTAAGNKGKKESIKVLKHAFDLGINYVDTAHMYSRQKNELLVGEAIKGRRTEIFVSTKNNYRGTSGNEWQTYLKQSLKRLGVDYIDFYHLHGLRWDLYRRMLGKEKPIEKFRKAKERGIIKHACFSSHDSPENIIKLIDTDEFDGMLVQYNLLDRRNEQAIAHAHKKGLGVAIMGPIGGGRLAAPSEKMKNFIRDSNSTPEISLRFVLSNQNVTIALSGMTTIDMVSENVVVASRKTPLSAKEKRGVSKALDEVKILSTLYCTGCGYCMPCPNNVDIPGNFKAMNLYRVWGLEETARKRFEQMKSNKKRKWAKACISCGECEPKCPQNIPIIKQLKETVATLSEN